MTTTVVAMSTPATGQPDADGTLVARIVAGDDRALGLVYDRYGSLVYGLARRVTSSCDIYPLVDVVVIPVSVHFPFEKDHHPIRRIAFAE